MLIHTVLNPLRSYTPFSIEFDKLKILFEERYGSCHNVLADDLIQHLEMSQDFTFKQNTVEQTFDGAMACYKWSLSYDNHTVTKLQRNRKTLELETSKKKIEHILENAAASPSDFKCNVQQWVTKNYNVDGDKVKIEDSDWKAIEPLEKVLYEFDSRYSFFLISGKSTPPDKYQGIANIPWLKVYDFEIDSRTSGLLSSVESSLDASRSFSISTCNLNPIKPLSNTSTDWFFPIGFKDVPDTVYTDSPLKWFNDNKQLLDQQFTSIANFCALSTTPVFLVLWYDQDENNFKFLSWILSVLYPSFKSETLPKKIVLCLNENNLGNRLMKDLIKTYELNDYTFCILPDTLYKWLSIKKVPKRSATNVLRLPKKSSNKNRGEVDIVEITKRFAWINEYIEVLSLESQDQIAQRKKKNFGKEFLKGGQISWDELASQNLAIERESQKLINESLKDDVLIKQKSIKIRILHAPGGGGTTLARQILWDLHTMVPCAVVVSTAAMWVSQVSERVRFLHDNTFLPIVILVDGHSELEVNQLYESCKYAIVILHVQRFNKKIPQNDFVAPSRICYLPGKVTAEEAKSLASLFSAFSPKSKNALNNLTKQKKDKYLFEYGLTAFNHEFKGVRKFVQGYLKLNEDEKEDSNLQNWQKVVAYLSLALYYGQSGLHRETFHELLIKKTAKSKFVSFEHLDYSGQQFVNQKERIWKISYHMVAKEILEQILSRCTDPSDSSTAVLSKTAKQNLHLLVIDFISMIKQSSNGTMPENILKILVNMIIRRNNNEVEMSDSVQKKCVLSQLLDDVPVKENRINILRELTQAFPQNAEFFAHLGRLQNRYNKYQDADYSLEKALEIRKKELASLHFKPAGEKDDILGRIHHIVGSCYMNRARNELQDKSRKKKKTKKVSKEDCNSLLEKVKKAIYHFSEVRNCATHNLSYGLIGEVQARLLVAEYVEQKFVNGCKKAFDWTLGEDYTELSQFVVESHSVCDQLLAECLHTTSEQDLQRVDNCTACIQSYTTFYGGIKKDIPLWKRKDLNIFLRRSQITSLKMTYHTGKNHLCVDNITQTRDLQRIINLHERNFRKILSEGIRDIPIFVDVLDWLEAIRHNLSNDSFSLVSVLEIVEKWELRNESPYATFYAYIINFILSLFSPGENLNREYYYKSISYREKLQKNRLNRDYLRSEWIAQHHNLTIRKIISKKKLGIWDKDTRFWKEAKNQSKLEVFTGTVIQSHHPLRGTITLDLTQANYNDRVAVYFVPKLYNLDNSVFGEKKHRVEFCIAFSMQHGAEAFSIKPLEKARCNYCDMDVERITINTENGKCIKCHR